jgi:hypothetical protein
MNRLRTVPYMLCNGVAPWAASLSVPCWVEVYVPTPTRLTLSPGLALGLVAFVGRAHRSGGLQELAVHLRMGLDLGR